MRCRRGAHTRWQSSSPGRRAAPRRSRAAAPQGPRAASDRPSVRKRDGSRPRARRARPVSRDLGGHEREREHAGWRRAARSAADDGRSSRARACTARGPWARQVRSGTRSDPAGRSRGAPAGRRPAPPAPPAMRRSGRPSSAGGWSAMTVSEPPQEPQRDDRGNDVRDVQDDESGQRSGLVSPCAPRVVRRRSRSAQPISRPPRKIKPCWVKWTVAFSSAESSTQGVSRATSSAKPHVPSPSAPRGDISGSRRGAATHASYDHGRRRR